MDYATSRSKIEQIYTIKHRELQRRQREYKKKLSEKLVKRKVANHHASIKKTTETLKEEKRNLRAQIWVANGHQHVRMDELQLHNIQCHILCQNYLSEDMQSIKLHIVHMEREISRLTRQVYELNCKTVPDSRHQEYVLSVRKKLQLLENQLEVGVRRECDFTAKNSILRTELINLVHDRAKFATCYTKMVGQLNTDRKYIMELIKCLMETYDANISIYDKSSNTIGEDSNMISNTKNELNALMRRNEVADLELAFLQNKNKHRKLMDLQPKEYKRREKFRRIHTRKLGLYSKIIDNILEYTGSSTIAEVISKYQHQESVYYSYFNFSNEQAYHMTLLNNSVDRLSRMIQNERNLNDDTIQAQTECVTKLEEQLEKRVGENNKFLARCKEHREQLNDLLEKVGEIVKMTGCDIKPLKKLLGDNSSVNLINLRLFLKILEKRICEIVASVYIWEREVRAEPYTVAEIAYRCEGNTQLDEIVLTQQCPECAEGEAYAVDQAAEVISVDETKEKLHEMVKQPEMQYLLHSISQCRLPRSRILAAKRNG